LRSRGWRWLAGGRLKFIKQYFRQFCYKTVAEQRRLKTLAAALNKSKKKVTSYPYHANTTGMHPSSSKKNSTLLKLQPPLLTNLKKEKEFFFF
jgi:hypothetical protein